MRWAIILVGVSVVSAPVPVAAQDQVQYRYDAQGRLIRVTRALSGRTSGNITNYTYDDADNRRQRVVTFGSFAALTLRPLNVPEIRLASTPADQPAFTSSDDAGSSVSQTTSQP
jgi:hypothetical protein